MVHRLKRLRGKHTILVIDVQSATPGGLGAKLVPRQGPRGSAGPLLPGTLMNTTRYNNIYLANMALDATGSWMSRGGSYIAFSCAWTNRVSNLFNWNMG